MVNKKLVLTALVLAGLALGALPAVASQTGIVLTPGLVNPIASQTGIVLMQGQEDTVFTGIGSSNSIGLDLGNCTNGTCSMSAVGIGTGLFGPTPGLPDARGIFTITAPANLDLELTNPQTGLWTAISKGDDITFTYKSGPSGAGVTLLTGELNLLQFQQLPPSKSGGQPQYMTTAALTVAGGTLEPPFYGGGPFAGGLTTQLYFTNTPKYLNTLLGKSGGQIASNFGHGTLLVTPEPASILLLGAAFLLVATFLRRRLQRNVSLGYPTV